MVQITDTEAKIKAIIADKLGIDEKRINSQSSFTNDLEADSLDVVELVMEFERAFDISIPDNEAEKIRTVAEAVEAIDNVKKNERQRNSTVPTAMSVK